MLVNLSPLAAPDPGPVPLVKVARGLPLPQRPSPGLSPGVHPAPVPASELYSKLSITLPAAAPAPDGEPAGTVDFHPGSPPEPTAGPLADVSPAPAATLELHKTLASPSPAPLPAPDEEMAGGLDCYPGPPPEPASVPPGEVDPTSAPTMELHTGPAIPSLAFVVAPDEKPAGWSDSYPGPPPEPTTGPVAVVDPSPSSTPELDVAQVLPQLRHQRQMESQMERWIPTLDHLQNQILGHQLKSILLLLQRRSSTEQQLFHHQLQLWQQMDSPLEVQILNLGHLQSRFLDHLVVSILVLHRHRSSIEHHLSPDQLLHWHQVESPQESWIFTLGSFQNRLQDHFLSQILVLQQHWSWVQQQVICHQVEHWPMTESLLEDQILFLGQHHNRLLDCLVRSIMLLD
nr:wiskott-Aldrich syndrome protein family member 1-like isoform X1 [Loxodonta africana]